ncbi:MAG: hypothetical protein NVSMB51_02870 [Solirubrobacteraceae bacterium]
MLLLRRGTVREAGPGDAAEQQLLVELAEGSHRAVCDTALLGRCAVGDAVIVNTQARQLGLGSGGFDIVHVNLTRGLAGEGVAGAHVMKLNYSSLQHAVLPVDGAPRQVLGCRVAVLALHGQLAPLAWAFGGSLGYVQTAGGALPGSHSRVVAELLDRDMLAGHITAGPAYGGALESVTTAGALAYGFAELGWEAAVCGPGPGIIGSNSALGHGGMAALDSAHTALALGARALLVPRMSSADPRPRHQGFSHHTRTVLELVLAPLAVGLPEGEPVPAWGARHDWRIAGDDLAGYREAGLPTLAMGREDELFLRAALASGAVLARL